MKIDKNKQVSKPVDPTSYKMKLVRSLCGILSANSALTDVKNERLKKQ